VRINGKEDFPFDVFYEPHRGESATRDTSQKPIAGVHEVVTLVAKGVVAQALMPSALRRIAGQMTKCYIITTTSISLSPIIRLRFGVVMVHCTWEVRLDAKGYRQTKLTINLI